jgi:hypothetical protein
LLTSLSLYPYIYTYRFICAIFQCGSISTWEHKALKVFLHSVEGVIFFLCTVEVFVARAVEESNHLRGDDEITGLSLHCDGVHGKL